MTVPISRDGTTVTSESHTLAGLTVVKQYFFVPDLPIVRVILQLTNTGPVPVTRTVRFDTDLGGALDTFYTASSSGDAAVTTADRWFIGHTLLTMSRPTLTHVVYGPDQPAPTPVLVEALRPWWAVAFPVSVENGQTV